MHSENQRPQSHFIGGLKDFSDVLKTLNPGDRVTIVFLRDGKEMSVSAEAAGR